MSPWTVGKLFLSLRLSQLFLKPLKRVSTQHTLQYGIQYIKIFNVEKIFTIFFDFIM